MKKDRKGEAEVKYEETYTCQNCGWTKNYTQGGITERNAAIAEKASRKRPAFVRCPKCNKWKVKQTIIIK